MAKKQMKKTSTEKVLRGYEKEHEKSAIWHLNRAIAAVTDGQDRDDVMREISEAILFLGEARGCGNIAVDFAEGELP